MAREYKVKCVGTDDPFKPYTLSYGKGGKKLVAVIERAGSIFSILIDGKKVGGKIRELKEQWGAWAIANYVPTVETVVEGISTGTSGVNAIGTDNVVCSSSEVTQVDDRTDDKVAASYETIAREQPDGSYKTFKPIRRAPVADDDEALPVVAPKDRGEKLAELRGHEVCVHIPSPRFPYTDGFAMFDIATSQQVGWAKHKDDAMKSLSQTF